MVSFNTTQNGAILWCRFSPASILIGPMVQAQILTKMKTQVTYYLLCYKIDDDLGPIPNNAATNYLPATKSKE